jgi:hypothetical protein
MPAARCAKTEALLAAEGTACRALTESRGTYGADREIGVPRWCIPGQPGIARLARGVLTLRHKEEMSEN